MAAMAIRDTMTHQVRPLNVVGRHLREGLRSGPVSRDGPPKSLDNRQPPLNRRPATRRAGTTINVICVGAITSCGTVPRRSQPGVGVVGESVPEFECAHRVTFSRKKRRRHDLVRPQRPKLVPNQRQRQTWPRTIHTSPGELGMNHTRKPPRHLATSRCSEHRKTT